MQCVNTICSDIECKHEAATVFDSWYVASKAHLDFFILFAIVPE